MGLVSTLLLVGLAAVFSNRWLHATWYTAGWQDDVRSFGFTLMTAGVLSAVFELIARREVEAFMERRLADTVKEINNAAVQINATGLLQYCPVRSYRGFEEMLVEARTFFWAVGTALPDVSSNPFVALLKERLERDRRFTVKMLFLNPFSFVGALKNNTVAYRHDLFSEIAESIVRLRKLSAQLSDGARKRLEVRVYSTLPTVSCVLTDRRMNISFYDENRAANRTPAWVFVPHAHSSSQESLYDYYQHNFDVIWNRSDSIDALGQQFQTQILSLYEQERERVDGEIGKAMKKLQANFA